MKKNVEPPRPYQRINPVKSDVPSFASALKGIPLQSSPAMVLDDSCLVSRDLDNYVLGEVKQFSSINNLRVILLKFMINWEYHHGSLELPRLTNAQSDFVSSERVVWVDIEGVPLHAWSRPTFCKIGSKWGEVMELEENNNDYFARKRLCVKTKQTGNILESFKIVIKGKIFVVRAKELFVWSPSFKEVPEAVYCSDDDSVKGDDVQNVVTSKQDNLEVDSDGEAVPDSFFGEQVDELENEIVSDQPIKEKEASSDPFNIIQSYLASLISQWDGESIVMGNFNEVRSVEERWGSTFNALGASVFNDFITNSGLSEVQLEGYSFTWTHPLASKMSKLDRFLVTEGLLSSFPNISAICLDRHLSDHRPILLREIYTDFGATPFYSNQMDYLMKFYEFWVRFLNGGQGFEGDAFGRHSLFILVRILVMESFHLAFSRATDAGVFNGIRIGSSLMISHLFYADDAVFIGEWSQDNLIGIMHILRCFSLLSGLSINIKKSHLLGIGVPSSRVKPAAESLGCSVMSTPFNYLGIKVGGNMSMVNS
ncbi:RNA-directed DNA polymerase, eukaryota [Tanacetum coccineum]